MEIKFIDFTTTLKPNQTKNLETKVFLNGEEISNINSVHLNMKYSNDESILKINFENHIGEKFFVRQSINRNKVKILETKRE